MESNKKEQYAFVESAIKQILDLMRVNYSLEFQEGGDESWFFIKTPGSEAPLLIGENGKHLAAFSYLIKKIYEKKFFSAGAPEAGAHAQFLIDINDYNKKRVEEIKDQARMHAQRVRYFKKEVEMRPMNAYDRRIVHSVLQEYPDITTESSGEGVERRVVIKPLNLV